MRFALPLAALLASTAPLAHAEGLTNMTEAERSAFNEAVRAYILDNPEVLIEAMEVYQAREMDQAAERDKILLSENKEAITRNPNDWAGGNLEGDITLVEFMDYRCGYCHKAYADVESLIKSDGNIRFVLKEFPVLGEQSTLAAQFTIAIKQLHGDDAYKAAHDALFGFRGEISHDSLSRLAENLKLDYAALSARMSGPEVAAVIEENYAIAQMFGINGTPTFILEDGLIQGYVPLNEMEKLVAQAREKS